VVEHHPEEEEDDDGNAWNLIDKMNQEQ